MSRTFDPAAVDKGRVRKRVGFFTSFLAAVRTANAIEAGRRPSAGDLATLDIAAESLPPMR